MDKESKASPAAQTQQVPQGRPRREPHTPSLILPNPYKSDPSLRGYQSGLSSIQKSTNTNGLSARKDGARPHARESSHNARPKVGSTGGPLTKTSKGDNETPAQGRNLEKTTRDLHKRVRGLPDAVAFEVKMDDFPELSGKADPPCWGPPTLSCQDEKFAPMNRKAAHSGPLEIALNAKSDSPKFRGESSAAQDSSPGSVTSSWANIAAQPPKKPIPKETISKSIQQVDEVEPQEEESTTGKKKRKKKKKKAKCTEDAETGSEKAVYYQEPPKFEDEEEFPGLTPALNRANKLMTISNTANLCNDENQRQIQHQPADEKMDKTLSAKSLSTETMKKAQKTEKVSGKKSKVPVQLDIGNMLAVLEKKQSQKTRQDTKPLTLSVGGGLPVVPKQQPIQKKLEKIAHNPLDSTSPLIKKGKQREVPKAKKPTALKKVILKEREERKQRRLLEERGLLPESESKPAEETAEEETCETTVTDEMHCSPDELDDQPEVNGTCKSEKEEDEEATEEQNISTITTHVDQPKIHSRKFRDYCTQMLSKDVDECVTALLKELVRFQDRLYQKDPMKARMKRRIVMGLREVLKHLKLRKVKCVIISPNCERSQSKGGLDEALHAIIDTCREQEVPFVFALSRKALGRCVNKAVPVSLVGIFNFDGAQDLYHKMIELSSEARKAYEVMVLSIEQTPQSEPAANSEHQVRADQINAVSDLDSTQPEEPEYIKLWKKLLEKDSNDKYRNAEEQLSSMHLDNNCTDHSSEDDLS